MSAKEAQEFEDSFKQKAKSAVQEYKSQTEPKTNPTTEPFRLSVQISCKDLPVNDKGKVDPIAVVYGMQPGQEVYSYIGQTEVLK